jgi:hypothetical protein
VNGKAIVSKWVTGLRAILIKPTNLLSLILVFFAGAIASSSSVFPINFSFTFVLLFFAALLAVALLIGTNRSGKLLSVGLAVLMVLGSTTFGFLAGGAFQADGRSSFHSELISRANEQCEILEDLYQTQFEKETLQDALPGSIYTVLGGSQDLPWHPSDTGDLLYLEGIYEDVYLIASSERESSFNTWFYLLEAHSNGSNPQELKLKFLGDIQGISITDFRRSQSLPPNEIYAVHMSGRVESMRLEVSTLKVDPITSSIGLTQTIFSTKPSIPSVGVASSGGRLLVHEGKGYLTVGDFSYGVSDMATFIDKLQNRETRELPPGIGATYQIDLESFAHNLFTKGHRNQQGLAADRWGRIWSTEHGPLGGSEVNLLRQGGFYGWPDSTLGKPYDGFERIQDAPGFVVAASVIPSFREETLSYWCNSGGEETIAPQVLLSGPLNFAPSELVFIGDAEEQKMIIGTLAGESLLVSSVSSKGLSEAPIKVIRLGERVRDLVVSTSGNSLLFTNDSKEIFRIDIRNPD